MSFTHLQVRSGYSLFKSTMTIDKLIQRAQALDFTSLALTDEEVLYGAIPFYKACKKNGIKPLLDRKSTRLNSSHVAISYAVFCLKKKKKKKQKTRQRRIECTQPKSAEDTVVKRLQVKMRLVKTSRQQYKETASEETLVYAVIAGV